MTGAFQPFQSSQPRVAHARTLGVSNSDHKPYAQHGHPLRFSGYHWQAQQAPTLWKTGTKDGREMVLEYVVPGQQAKAIEMTKTGDGRYWQANLPEVDGDTVYYRFWNDSDDIEYDLTEKRTFTEATAQHPKGEWNVARTQRGASKTGSMLYAYLDSYPTHEAVESQKSSQRLTAKKAVDSESRFHGSITGVQALVDKLNTDTKSAISAVMLTPHTGDWSSAHHYWTADPYALSDAFPTNDSFEQFFTHALKKGVRVYCDGAFVNQGFASPLYQSLLLYGPRSPFWKWFLFNPEQHLPQNGLYPDVATHQKMVIGTLPVHDTGKGAMRVDWSRVGLRVINSPFAEDYNPAQPVYLEQFDPKADKNQWTHNDQAVHPFRWPVLASEFKNRVVHSSLWEKTTEIVGEQAANFLEWPYYRLGRPDEDNSGHKWDGKVQAIKMDLTNPAVQTYTQNAIAHWTRRVFLNQVDTLASALHTERKQAPGLPWQQTIDKALATHVGANLLQGPTQVPYTALTKLHRDLPDEPLPTGAKLESVLDNVAPALSVSLPPTCLMLKATLTDPSAMADVMENTGWRKWLKPITGLLKFLVGGSQSRLGSKIDGWQKGLSVRQQLASVLDKTIQGLSDEQKQTLRHPLAQQLLVNTLAPALWQQAFMGTAHTQSPEDSVKALTKALGPDILLADSSVAKSRLRKAMLRHLEKMPIHSLQTIARTALDSLDPESLTVAQSLVNQHELGLNWRLDAAKDVANIDKVRNAVDTKTRHKLFGEEMRHAAELWATLLEKARQIYPKTSIIAELTEMTPLGGQEGGREATDLFLSPQHRGQGSLFTGAVNMDNFFSTILRLIHHDPKPYEFGQTQMKVSSDNQHQSFWQSALEPFVYSHTKKAAEQTQTFTASHDYSNTLYNLLRHPVTHSMDYYPYRGLEEDVRDIFNTLAYKPDFAQLRSQLRQAGMSDPEESLEVLADKVQEIDHHELPELVQPLYRKDDKEDVKDELNLPEPPKNMSDVRVILGQHLLDTLAASPEEGGEWYRMFANPVRGPQIRQALLDALATPSEVWATRGLLVNAFEAYDGDNKPSPEAFYEALDNTFSHWKNYHPRLTGYMSLARLVDELGSRLYVNDPTNQQAMDFKHEFFQHVLTPALKKDRRRIALMVALPGQPTWYDVFRSGGERSNNEFLQNREQVPLSWLDDEQKKFIQDEFAVIRDILSVRQQYPVINHGFLQAMAQDADNNVLLTAWDGGPTGPYANKQVLMMVNTGSPEAVDGETYNQMLGGVSEEYPHIDTTRPVIRKYEPDGWDLAQPVGTRYINRANGDTYVVNDDGLLKLEKGNGDLETFIVLERE